MPTAPGGLGDLLARYLSDRLAAALHVRGEVEDLSSGAGATIEEWLLSAEYLLAGGVSLGSPLVTNRVVQSPLSTTA